jgi:hypothetical protein
MSCAYLNRALYSPPAGLLAVAASIPSDQYEVVLTDENIETIDFDLKADLVGISAMTSCVNRGYEIADQFRSQGIPVARASCRRKRSSIVTPSSSAKSSSSSTGCSMILNKGRWAEPTGRTGCIRWPGCRCRVTIS